MVTINDINTHGKHINIIYKTTNEYKYNLSRIVFVHTIVSNDSLIYLIQLICSTN